MKSGTFINSNFISLIKNRLLNYYSIFTFFSLSPIVDSLNFIEGKEETMNLKILIY